ncbi:MAG: hypothetical protein KGI54_14915 [Pseudomonadota bacterium]|nr:hypothetical protein [Pseudomonadota bacterium]
MSLKTSTFTVTDNNRDKGKAFLITEMSADQAERWATRAFFAVMNAGAEIPDDMAGGGMAALASIGLSTLAKVPFEAAEPLLNEMMSCVQIIPNPAKPNIVRNLVDSDIEEVATRFKLKKAVWDLHVGFFMSAAE